MRRDIIGRSSETKSLCRERLRKILISGRKAEWVLFRFVGLLGTAILFGIVVGWLAEDFAFSLAPEPQYLSTLPPDRVRREFFEPPPEEMEASLTESFEQTVEIAIKRGDNLKELLVREGFSSPQAQEVVEAAGSVHDLRRLRDGTTFLLTYDTRDSAVLRLESAVDKDHLLIVERVEDGLKARREALQYEIQARSVSGTINGSLFAATDKAGLPPSVTMALAEIFDYDIDFHVDLRAGDTFHVLLEEKHLDGNFVRHGRVLAARMVNRGRTFWAFHFDGKGTPGGYFDRDGRSLRKAFLKSPLKFTRISSTFTQSRFHPILQIYRPHLGVDYAAPSGTPVRAVADGRIAHAGWEGGFGNLVKIQHNGTFTSIYGHLSRFGSGIKTAATVRQGQLIGYVGATGLATGPHLDFRLVRGGQFINPLKVNYINAEPVSRGDMAAFRQLVDGRVAQLDSGGAAVASTTGPKGL